MKDKTITSFLYKPQAFKEVLAYAGMTRLSL